MKAIDVARYLITLEAGEAQIDDESLKGFCVSHLKIQKMLYFCQVILTQNNNHLLLLQGALKNAVLMFLHSKL